ncbi:MAG: type I methionyl aminopeptidase, partial [Elusimicrobia bacterium]|nr:type I methionyl aminopeptidase [Elusimicrobiota bacterium]
MIKRKRSIELKSPAEMEKMRSAGKIVGEVLALLRKAVTAGISTEELDLIAEREIKLRGAKAAFLGYQGYPFATCVSVNDEVVHGMPSPKRTLKEGDIVGIDLGVFLDGYYGDSAITAPVGKISAQAQKLLEVTQTALNKAIAVVKPGGFIGDISNVIESWAVSNGMSVVKDFVGHGIGRNLHEDPAVPNYGERGRGAELKPGLVIAIEPMINAGGFEVKVREDGWTVVTADGSLSAMFEHTVAVTE